MKFPHLPACKCGHFRRDLTQDDEWYINAPSYHNCFWTYLRHNDRPHGLKEIADKLDVSISAITNIEKRALDKLKKRLKKLNISFDSFVTTKNN
jgi:predicted nucleic acid-binding protein